MNARLVLVTADQCGLCPQEVFLKWMPTVRDNDSFDLLCIPNICIF